MRMMIVAALILALGSARAAERVHVCRGVLTDQRSVGVSLGDRDINSLSDSDFKRVTKTCGEPNGVDEETNRTKCIARVMAKPKAGFPDIMTATKLVEIRAKH